MVQTIKQVEFPVCQDVGGLDAVSEQDQPNGGPEEDVDRKQAYSITSSSCIRQRRNEGSLARYTRRRRRSCGGGTEEREQ